MSHSESDFDTKERDFLTLGNAKLPLINLLSSSSGFDGNLKVIDQFNQTLGTLELAISLNHQSKKRGPPAIKRQHSMLDTEQVERYTLIDTMNMGLAPQKTESILTIHFSEIISRRLKSPYIPEHPLQRVTIYLRFRYLGQDHQIKYVPDPQNIQYLPLKIEAHSISKTWTHTFNPSLMSTEELSKPLEIQVWQQIEHQEKYQEVDEKLIGSTFIDLNQLTMVKSKSLKSTSSIFSHDGYFTVLDKDHDSITGDRLGLKLMLLPKEDQDTEVVIQQMLHSSSTKLTPALIHDLDTNLKGTVDKDELIQLIQDNCEVESVRLALLKYIDCLEYKNEDKVYYGPLFTTLPPYFKHARRLDKFRIVETIDQRLSSCDDLDIGFVLENHFKTILQDELRVKDKIVKDFLNELAPNPLDCNLKSHTLKLKKDILVMTRKLLGCLKTWGIIDRRDVITERQIAANTTPAILKSLTVVQQEVDLYVSIDSGNRIKNPVEPDSPPNTYVEFKPEFGGLEGGKIVTDTVYRSSFPSWKSYSTYRLSLTPENMAVLENGNLKFDVFHSQISKDGIQD